MDGRQGGRRGEGDRRQGWRGRAKPGNQLVIYIMDSASCISGWGSEFRVNMLDSESVVVTATISSLQSCMF